MYIDAVDIAWILFLTFCFGYFWHRYGSERDPDRDRSGSKWAKKLTAWFKRCGS